MAHENFTNPWGSSSCTTTGIVQRYYLYKASWRLRHRTGWTGASPQIGVHNKIHSSSDQEKIHSECHEQAGKVARDLDTLGRIYPPSSSNWALDWIGEVGIQTCKPGWHRHGLAIDFTRFNFSDDGRFVDMNRHWRDDRIRLRRRYLAVLAMCRKHFGVVLHGRNDPDGSHVNHIHVDRSRHAVALNKNNRTDATIVQWAGRDLAGLGTVIDGIWGSQTQTAYNTLMSKFKMTRASGGCWDFNPLSAAADMRIFMDMIGRHAFADKSAGAYTMGPPCPV